MAQSSWPSPDNSRVVNDFQYERLAVSYGPQAGLVGSPADTALVYGDSTGMQIKVRADRYAVIRGYEWWSGSSEFTKAISANASGSTRTDLVVLRLTRSSWNVTIEIVAGTPGAGAPAVTQNVANSGVWELPIATVTVTSGASTIAAGNVTWLGVYLDAAGGGYTVGSTAALAYVPGPYNGMRVLVAGASRRDRYIYDGSAWAGPGAITYGSDTTSLTATGSNPSKGDSSYAMEYLRAVDSPLIVARFKFVIGSTFGPGEGLYRFLLPAAASAGSISCAAGVARVVDNGVTIRVGAVLVVDATHCSITLDGFGDELGSDGPGTGWAGSDQIIGQILYEMA